MTQEHLRERDGRVEEATPPELREALLDMSPPFNVDWGIDDEEQDNAQKLLRLARVKALLPADNALDEKTTHDVTLENYIRLALVAAGSRDTLDTFLGHVFKVVEETKDPMLAQQIFWIWAPAAEITGLYHHKTQLEETAFKTLLPDDYESIRETYDKSVLESENGLLERTKEQLRHKLDAILPIGITYEVQARPKSNYSVWRKLRDENRESAELFDLLGFRIIIDAEGEDTAIEACYVAMAAVAAEYEVEMPRLKDYIKDPKPNGYRSLHLTLYTASGFPFEVQIRTRQMYIESESDDFTSHQGYDATYKETPGKIKRVFNKVPKLYRWRTDATRLIQDQHGSTQGVLGDEILFFRTDGNLYNMPASGNLTDATFRIHSELAFRAKKIYRNGLISNFTKPIKFGDVIEVEYGAKGQIFEPARFDTFKMMALTKGSHRAIERGKRHALAEHYRESGRRIIRELLGGIGLEDPLSVLDQKDRRELADKAGLPSFDKLIEIIGTGDVANGKPGRVVQWIKDRCGLGTEVKIKLVPESRGTLDNETVLEKLVIPTVDGSRPECRVGGCCSEKIVYGDEVLVRPSRADGIFKVHLVACRNIRDRSDTMICAWS